MKIPYSTTRYKTFSVILYEKYETGAQEGSPCNCAHNKTVCMANSLKTEDSEVLHAELSDVCNI